MNLSAVDRARHPSPALQERVFTVAQARRALSYLQRVLADAVDAYHLAQDARMLLKSPAPPELRASISRQRDAAIARLNRTIDECHAVGVCMLDLASGATAMNAHYAGSTICLLWRLGDPVETAWAELEAAPVASSRPCYAARQG